MRKLICLIFFAGLTACGGGDPVVGPLAGTDACSTTGQKQYVLDQLYLWYLWNDLLPAGIDIGDYGSAEELVSRVTLELGPEDMNGDPIDFFSSVGSLDADQQFFGEGKFEGFGFSWRFADAALTDFRITRTFSGSPAALGGLDRGHQVLSLNTRAVGDIQAAEGISAFFAANDTVDFEVQTVAGAILTPTISKAVVTIDPIPQWWIRDVNGRNVGYLELTTFISTADPVFDTVFQAFKAANVNEVILDLRYNGGGLVSTAELLGDYFGGDVVAGEVFSSTEFNADRAAANNDVEFFEQLGNSINLSQLVVIATRGTASASELVTNGMIPHVDVAIVGDRTFGKPVGQIGLEFCNKILRPTSFKLANSLGAGDYFDGLPVDCAAADDLSVAIGDDLDPNMIAAMSYLNTGACPVVATAPASQFKASGAIRASSPEPNAAPHRELLGAY
jgi:C-terminal processing protease CtpA/Prc